MCAVRGLPPAPTAFPQSFAQNLRIASQAPLSGQRRQPLLCRGAGRIQDEGLLVRPPGCG
jgi:hypothetical protein